MGASKTTQFSNSEIKTAKLARALAHPARVRILALLKQEDFIRNVDLVKDLQLVKSTVHAHIIKLKEADLIELDFHSNCYFIRPNKEVIDKIPLYLEQLN